MGKKIAFITGCNGMDGATLSRLLLDKEYSVIGLTRRSSTNTKWRIQELLDNKNFLVLEGDITDPHCVNHIINKFKPCEIYNTAAMSHVGQSFISPHSTIEIDGIGVLNILEAIKNYSNHSRLLQCSTSELYGSNYSVDSDGNRYQDENTPFSPNSPYSAAKLLGHNLVLMYRRAYNLHLSCAITFNHEGEFRGEEFVTRKITKYVGKLYNTLQNGQNIPKLKLGNVFSHRDWFHSQCAVRGMWLMLQQPKGDEYVLSSGESHTVKEFAEIAFGEIGVESTDYIEYDKSLERPCEVDFLKGRSDKAKRVLDWQPEITFRELVMLMVHNDIDIERRNYNGNAQFSRVAQ